MTTLTRKPVLLLDLTKLTARELARLHQDGFDIAGREWQTAVLSAGLSQPISKRETLTV